MGRVEVMGKKDKIKKIIKKKKLGIKLERSIEPSLR